MSTEIRPAHSPLGASGAERWMSCPGSVALLNNLGLIEQSDEPEYRSLGTSAHEVAHHCLVNKLDTWEVVGIKFGEHVCDQEMANAVQTYLDEVRGLIEADSKAFFEFSIDAPDFHPQFYGTLDAGVITGTRLRVRDFKYGEGIAVDTEENPQIMYYAFGLLRHHPEVETVEFRIVQPRIEWHNSDPWEVSADYIRNWAESVLHPAMLRTEMDDDLDAGPWCRFCPAKLVCPLMTSLFGAAMTADPKLIVNLSDEALGRSYQYTKAVEFYVKALQEQAFTRLQRGKIVPGVKLVAKKANRVFKAGADKVFQELWPKEAMTEPKLKSPAEMEKIGPTAAKLVLEHAYTPQTGLTVALESDKRAGVKIQSAAEAFPGAVAAAEGA